MKKFIDLVKNESLKLWGQRSFRVLLIIIGVILVLTPFSSFALDSALGSLEFEVMTHEDYRQKADEARAAGNELEAREYEVYYDVELYFIGTESNRRTEGRHGILVGDGRKSSMGAESRIF